MDVLTEWLQEIGTSAVILSRSRLPAPWGMRIAAQDGVMFHIVTEGACWLRRPREAPLRLLQGDLVLLPHGLDHDLVDDPASAAEPLETFLAQPARTVTGGSFCTVICGVYLSDAHLTHPLLRTLPPVVRFTASSVRQQQPLHSALGLLLAELEQPLPGSEALIQHLFDALFVYIVRAWAAESTDRPGWLSALRDSSLVLALRHMHANPAQPWSVESLAAEAGLSRAVFARRFAEQVGETPLAYLTRWRMGIAARLLRDSDVSLAEVAAKVGYESEFAFSRAFKRDRGVPPARFRRESVACPKPERRALALHGAGAIHDGPYVD